MEEVNPLVELKVGEEVGLHIVVQYLQVKFLIKPINTNQKKKKTLTKTLTAGASKYGSAAKGGLGRT